MSDYNNNHDDRECVCSVCHRSESKAGRMLTLPGGISICVDCLQKTITNFDLSGMDPNMLGGMNPFMGFPMTGFPYGGNMPDVPEEPEEETESDPQISDEADDMDGQHPSEDPSDEQIPDLSGNEDASGPSAGFTPAKSSGAVKDAAEQLKKGGIFKQPDPKLREEAMKRAQENRDKMKNGKKTPNISFINLSDLQNSFGRRQQIKRKDPSERKTPLIDPSRILPPHKLKAKLDEYVVGQEKAKKAISVAVYNHYKRIIAGDRFKDDDVEIEKSNMLLIGPTGCGKTYIVKTLAKLLDVPLAITDATSLTEAGYIGDDIESVLSKLLQAADNDLDRAEIGIVFIDEIDKIAKKNSNRGRDVSGESVQQGLLKLLEGAEVEVPVGAASKNAMVPLTTVNTRNILFICGGAFPDLEEIIKERVKKKTSMGFGAELKDKYDNDENIMDKVTTEDLRKFGMIPEFLGRLPIVCTLQKLTGEMLVQVLKEPKNAILKQYQKLLEMDEVQLEFEDDALLALTERAEARETGARGLRSILEEIMLDIMYEIPKDDSIGKVIITRDYIENNGAPIITIRSNEKQNWIPQLPPPDAAKAE